MSGYLSQRQVEVLLHPINPARVRTLDGLAHLEAYDIRVHLNRIFGFGRWSGDVLDMSMLFEQETTTKAGKPAYKVAYRCSYRLSVNAPDGTPLATYTEVAIGEALMPDSKRGDTHDMAAKTAESQALKRCAVNLGDAFGISLYQKGSREALVKNTLVKPEQTEADAPAELPETAPVVPEQAISHDDDEPSVGVGSPSPAENVTPPPDTTEATSPAPEVDLAVAVGALREQIIEILKLPARREALQKLTHLQIQAGRQKLMEQPTHSPLGEPMTVQMLLDGAVKSLSRAGAA